jgi:hypothetical protein
MPSCGVALLFYKLSEATPKVGDAATVPKRAFKAVSLNDLLDELDRRQKDNAADAPLYPSYPSMRETARERSSNSTKRNRPI